MKLCGGGERPRRGQTSRDAPRDAGYPPHAVLGVSDAKFRQVCLCRGQEELQLKQKFKCDTASHGAVSCFNPLQAHFKKKSAFATLIAHLTAHTDASGDSAAGGPQKVNPWICVTARRHRGVGGGGSHRHHC